MIRVSAPGKLIVAGEHAAVYGRPALVAALGARTRVTLGAAEPGVVRLVLPDVGVDEEAGWGEIEAYGTRTRTAWQAYEEAPGPERLAALSTGDPAHVVKVALAETAHSLGATPGGLTVDLRSDLPVGSGFGSSASVAVATIGAVFAQVTGRIEPYEIERVALEVERRQHGRPSGADHATVLYGGLQWFERNDSGDLQRTEVAFDRRHRQRLSVFHTGRPAESTGEMVESVRRRFADRPDRLGELLDELEADVRALRIALTGPGNGQIGAYLSGYERGLERLGVVPEAIREQIRAVERAGGAAKVSGAGALSGSAAGAVLAYSRADEAALEPLRAYQRLEAELAVQGLRREPNVEATLP